MKFSLRDRSATLGSQLEELRYFDVSYETTTGMPDTLIRSHVPTAWRNLDECNLDFLFRYEIFPPEILKFFGEWQLEDRAMRVGGKVIVGGEMDHRCDSGAAKPAQLRKGLSQTIVRCDIARDDNLGFRRRMRRPFPVESNLQVMRPHAVDERAPDQPAAARDNQGFLCAIGVLVRAFSSF